MFIAEFWYKYIHFLVKSWHISLLIAVVFFITKVDCYAGYYLFWSVFLISGCMGFAYRYSAIRLETDISYGLFLYHMIVINIFVHFKLVGNWLYAVVCILLAVLLAYISTITIGKWSANMKRNL